MEQRISLVTLGVVDLRRSRAFYERLGWRGQEVEDTVFFQAGGMALVLWGREKLALDCGLDASGELPGGIAAFSGVVLAHNVRSRHEVDEVLRQAAEAGAGITRVADETFYCGYAGCFRDPDGHLWEVAYNPGFPLAADGSLTVPELGGT